MSEVSKKKHHGQKMKRLKEEDLYNEGEKKDTLAKLQFQKDS